MAFCFHDWPPKNLFTYLVFLLSLTPAAQIYHENIFYAIAWLPLKARTSQFERTHGLRGESREIIRASCLWYYIQINGTIYRFSAVPWHRLKCKTEKEFVGKEECLSRKKKLVNFPQRTENRVEQGGLMMMPPRYSLPCSQRSSDGQATKGWKDIKEARSGT